MPWDDVDLDRGEPDHQVAIRIEPPPLPLLAVAALTAIISWTLMPFGVEAAHLAGWAFGSLITIGLLTSYTAVDARRSRSTRYASVPWAGRTRMIVLLGGILAASGHAYLFATRIAR